MFKEEKNYSTNGFFRYRSILKGGGGVSLLDHLMILQRNAPNRPSGTTLTVSDRDWGQRLWAVIIKARRYRSAKPDRNGADSAIITQKPEARQSALAIIIWFSVQ